MEQRTLLAVMMTAASWKDFDFKGTGPFAGTFTGGALPRGITGRLSGTFDVVGKLTYRDQFYGQGNCTVNGNIKATVVGRNVGEITISDQPGTIVTNNPNVTIDVPGQSDADGNPMQLKGTINLTTFAVAATTTVSLGGFPGKGTWNGTVSPTSNDPFTVQVSPEWDKDEDDLGTVHVAVQTTGPVQKAASQSGAAANVNLAWGYFDSKSQTLKSLKTLPDMIPIYWNQATGNYVVTSLLTPPVKATHLLFVTKIGRTSQTTALLLSDLPTTAALQIEGVTVTEPVRGTVNAEFKVSLTGKSLAPVTVKYQTLSDTATSGTDFVAKSGTLTFTPGKETTQKIVVKVKADKVDEGPEQFFVRLSDAMYAAISETGQAIGTILPPRWIM